MEKKLVEALDESMVYLPDDEEEPALIKAASTFAGWAVLNLTGKHLNAALEVCKAISAYVALWENPED
jgi:hypothetical protein